MKKIIPLLSLLLPSVAFCQNIVTDALIVNQIENMIDNNEEEIDYTELTTAYWDLCEQKINVNEPEELAQLIEFHLISTYIIESVNEYRRKYGDIRFFDELKAIDGIDEMTLTILEPMLCFERKETGRKDSFGDVFKFGRNQLVLQVDRNLNKKAGYQDVSDSVLFENPSKKYLGGPQRIFTRYNFSYRDKIEAGFALEKDAGEYLFHPKVNDSIKKLLDGHLYKTIDFWSAHFLIRDISISKALQISTLAIGDYQVGFGQGVTLGSGVAFTGNGGSLLRKSKNIRASKSANEANYLRGVATTIRLWKFNITAFYSDIKADANVSAVDSLGVPQQISSLQQTGLHRTFGELIDRQAITKRLYGGNISFRTRNLQIGYTIHNTDLSCELHPDPRIYNTFYFRGGKLVNQGVDFYYITKKISFYGELATSDNMAPAGLLGTTVQPAGYIDFTILYRYYDKKYQNFYSNAFAAGSGTRNEKGVYLSTSMALAPRWRLTAAADFPQSDWFKTTAYAPNKSQIYNIQLNHQIDSKSLLSIQLKYRDKEKNGDAGNTYMRNLIHERKMMLRFHVTFPAGKSVTLKNRVEYHVNNTDNQSNTNSYLIYQDVIFQPDTKPFSFAFRYALFDSQDGSVYAYENDVLYSFSISSLYHKGMRIYLLGKVKIAGRLSVNAKIGCTVYSDINEISSGLELIEGNVKADGKLQMILKL